MLKVIFTTSILLSFFFIVSADEYVKGYFKKDGTYVNGYYRTEANSTKDDNYSTKGNTNIYTGEKGYKDNDYESSTNLDLNNSKNDNSYSSGTKTWVNGYYRKDGTYVNGHYRSK
jgi:hypothetical protein